MVGEIKFGGGSLLGGMSKFSAGREGLNPHSPSRENPEQEGWEVAVENMAFPEVSKK